MSKTLPIIRDWSDGYVALKTRAEQLRGSIELNPDTPDWERWPRTTGADVVAIAAFIDSHLRAQRSFAKSGLARRWNACLTDLELYAIPRLGESYSENRAYWRCLAAAFVYLSSVEAPLAAQARWTTLLAAFGELAEYRNEIGRAHV